MMKFLARMWVAFKRYEEKRAAYMVLQAMSDKQLRDLGITRGEIRSRVFL